MKSRLLFVDDEPHVLSSLERTLRGQRSQWEMRFVDSSPAAWKIIQEEPVDLVISDLRMPDMDGLELLSRVVKFRPGEDLPMIIVTGTGDRQQRRMALEMGAADLLCKPIDSEDLAARIRNALRMKAYRDQLKNQNELLERKVAERTAELANSRLSVVQRLAKAAEYRDEDTGNHVLRVGFYCRAIAQGMGMERSLVERLLITATLHDIGKIGIPDSILLKPGRLTPEERAIMEQHCMIGAKILTDDLKTRRLLESLDSFAPASGPAQPDPLLEMAACIALTHHEKWDGSGYPQRLAGEAIPLVSRIVAISDVFDALTSARPYKPAFPEQRVLEILRESRGSHFDPDVHGAFEDCLEQIRAIRSEFGEPLSTSQDAPAHEACTVC